MHDPVDEKDYRSLADFRCALRGFIHFSEKAAGEVGLSGQQYQAMTIIRAKPDGILIGELAEWLMLQPHSATGLVDRLGKLDLAERRRDREDRRQVRVVLTDRGKAMLAALVQTHRDELRRIRPLLTELIDKL